MNWPLIETRVLIDLAGPAAQHYRSPPPRLQTPRHESAHIVVARALGQCVGACSAVAVEDVLGYASWSPVPIVPSVFKPGRFKRGNFITDYRDAANYVSLALPYPASCWGILGEIRKLRVRSRALVRAHWTVIRRFAEEVLEAGGQTSVEQTNCILEQIELESDGELVAAFLGADPLGRVNLPVESLARLYVAAQQQGWCALVSAVEAEANRFVFPLDELDQLGGDQPRSIARLIAVHGAELASIG